MLFPCSQVEVAINQFRSVGLFIEEASEFAIVIHEFAVVQEVKIDYCLTAKLCIPVANCVDTN